MKEGLIQKSFLMVYIAFHKSKLQNGFALKGLNITVFLKEITFK